jgi:alpha/beta superfamily hydrolase
MSLSGSSTAPGVDEFENHRFKSGDLTLAAHLARPPRDPQRKGLPGVVICHGFPSGPDGGANSVATFPELAFRIATEIGWVAMVPYLRGMPGSEGDFSLDGWRDDVVAAAADLRNQSEVDRVWVAGFGSGAALAICATAIDDSISGVAALAAPADWSDWAANPRRLLLHARDAGLLTMSDLAPDFDRWSSALGDLSAERAVASLAPRDLLLVHGGDDEIVPSLDARVVASAHGAATLRIIAGAGHHLRHDPRAIAILLGWLDRQRRQHA